MIRPCKAILLDRMQMIKTEEDNEYRFSKVLLVRSHLFSKVIIPYEATSFKTITEMKHFHEGERKFFPIDIGSLRLEKDGYSFNFLCKEESYCG